MASDNASHESRQCAGGCDGGECQCLCVVYLGDDAVDVCEGQVERAAGECARAEE